MDTYRADKIRGRQAELDWSNEKFAAAAQLTEPTIVALRKGRPVSRRSLEKAVTALKLTMADIYEPAPEFVGTP